MNLPAWLSWSNWAVATAGVVIGVWRLQRRSLRYYVQTIPLVGASDAQFGEQVQITFAGRPVQSLFRTDILIWNAGICRIRREDVAPARPVELRVDSRPGSILAVRTVAVGTLANAFQHSLIRREEGALVRLAFEYLDPEDGAVIEILHTEGDLSTLMHGTLKGGKMASRPARVRPRAARAWRLVLSAILPGSVWWWFLATTPEAVRAPAHLLVLAVSCVAFATLKFNYKAMLALDPVRRPSRNSPRSAVQADVP